MSNLTRLPLQNDMGLFRVVVETPRGECRKIDYDDDLKCFFIKRRLPLGLSYPFHFGFLPCTRGEDGDPLDAIALAFDATFPGLVLNCRIIGALKVSQKEGKSAAIRNDRFIAIPDNDIDHASIKDVGDLAKEQREEIETFLVDSVKLEAKKLEFLGWIGRPAAVRMLHEADKGGKKRKKRRRKP